jgi:hypothetical protein
MAVNPAVRRRSFAESGWPNSDPAGAERREERQHLVVLIGDALEKPPGGRIHGIEPGRQWVVPQPGNALPGCRLHPRVER